MLAELLTQLAFNCVSYHAKQANVPKTHLNSRDEGHELRTLQAILIQCLRMPVGCGHQRDASVKQTCEEASQDHRVCDVCDE